MMEINVPVPSSDVTLQRVGNEAILYDKRNGRAHVINNSAARIWELCNGTSTFEQICTAFGASYGLSAETVANDVRAILTTFAQLKVLEV